jgi:hypothetical protein
MRPLSSAVNSIKAVHGQKTFKAIGQVAPLLGAAD